MASDQSKNKRTDRDRPKKSADRAGSAKREDRGDPVKLGDVSFWIKGRGGRLVRRGRFKLDLSAHPGWDGGYYEMWHGRKLISMGSFATFLWGAK